MLLSPVVLHHSEGISTCSVCPDIPLCFAVTVSCHFSYVTNNTKLYNFPFYWMMLFLEKLQDSSPMESQRGIIDIQIKALHGPCALPVVQDVNRRRFLQQYYWNQGTCEGLQKVESS